MNQINFKNRVNILKLKLLQKRYNKLTDIIIRLGKHIDNLFNINYMDFLQRNHILSDVFNLSKNVNDIYNNYILKELEIENELYIKIYSFLELCHDINDDYFLSKMIPLIDKDMLPLQKQFNDLYNIIYDIGYDNIEDLLNLLNRFELNNNQTKLINEISQIFIPTKITYFNVSNNDEYYWRVPIKYNDNDLLELNRELWIKNIESKTEYIKIDGYFINDTLSCFIRSCQIKYPELENIKNNILKELKKTNIDIKFIQKFYRYDYLGNIYVLSIKEYVKYIQESYNKYIEITNLTFVNIMKEFIADNGDVKKIYKYIFLLLLGNNENADIAGLLLGLMKEKKTNCPQIYNLLNQRLPYYLLVKIKKSNNSIKNEIDKLKTVSIEDIDYKKQLITNKNIPQSVKTLTLEKIEEMKSFNNEYYKQLTYVKNIINYPWSTQQDTSFMNIDNPKNFLDNIQDKLKKLSYGHEEAKKMLLQIIGKWITNPSSQGTCFGLVGPPGVGKTLLAKSISKALDIPFAEITLGGQNDGEILHGHGYTYSGSQPGLIIKKMVDMGKQRCILYFDELDKTCSKHGSINEITSILIHLTDPNMNKTFQDRFFQGVDFPLDKVIMIFSYNDSNLVDPILLDRLKEIKVEAYTIDDKKRIVKEFIIPELAENIGLQNEPWINISTELIEFIVDNYTNEAGVRSIKRKIEQILLTLNIDKIYERFEFENNIEPIITKETILRILEKPKIENTIIHENPSIGIINGLYATSSGEGGIISIQIFNNYSPNQNIYEIKLTGKQGDVMKESVHCSLTTAINYIRKNTQKYNIDNIDDYLLHNFKYGFHVHAPSTSTPKDGPSAGCAFTSAFISRILNKPIKNDIGMTGEIELTGKITKIGGLNFKLIGAKKAGIKLVFVPKENEKDLNDIKIKYPLLIDDNFQVKICEYIDDLIDLILV